MQIAAYKKDKAEFAEKIRDFQEDVKNYKSKIKSERENLEKILAKSDKVIGYLHNAAMELAKSIGKILHNLVLNVDFDMKDVLKRVAVEDMSRIHEWIQWFERNDYLKKNKLYRNMAEKLNFYKKLEIPVLQEVYGRISRTLKAGERLAEKGEFSVLNTSQANFVNKSVLSTNKSVISNRNDKNESMQNDGYMMNILDELNNDGANMVNVRKESLAEAIARLQDKINGDALAQMTPQGLSDSIKRIQGVAGELTRQAAVRLRGPDRQLEGGRGRGRGWQDGGRRREPHRQKPRVLRR